MSLLDLLFPKKCVSCGRLGEYLCTNCFAKLSFDNTSICIVCDNPCIGNFTHPICASRYAIDGVFCGFSYKGSMKKLVYSFKYKPYLSDLGTYLSNLLYESLIQQEQFMNRLHTDVVFVPVPLSQKKLRVRGYNQAEILAKNMSTLFYCSMVSMLERTKDTKPQFELKRDERKENIKNAFAFNSKLKSQNSKVNTVFLVDDVLTTGATLLEAANVLKRNGFGKVYGVCLARDY